MRFKRRCELLDGKSVFKELLPARFLRRTSRFTTIVEVNGHIHTAHLTDTGRLKELLKSGMPALLAPNPKGRLNYKLIAVKKERWVLLYTPVHVKIAEEILKRHLLGFKVTKVQREVRRENSRIDILADRDFFLEVKGSNLLSKDVCLFPDAPTERGRRHIETLIKLKRQGFKASLLFLTFRRCRSVLVSKSIDPKLWSSFKTARELGVGALAVRLLFSAKTGKVYFERALPVL